MSRWRGLEFMGKYFSAGEQPWRGSPRTPREVPPLPMVGRDADGDLSSRRSSGKQNQDDWQFVFHGTLRGGLERLHDGSEPEKQNADLKIGHYKGKGSRRCRPPTISGEVPDGATRQAERKGWTEFPSTP